jgi:hypothetical protein
VGHADDKLVDFVPSDVARHRIKAHLKTTGATLSSCSRSAFLRLGTPSRTRQPLYSYTIRDCQGVDRHGTFDVDLLPQTYFKFDRKTWVIDKHARPLIRLMLGSLSRARLAALCSGKLE